MLEQGNEIVVDMGSSSASIAEHLSRGALRWLTDTAWSGRNILVWMVDLALVALAFSMSASFFSPSVGSHLSPASTAVFLPLALLLCGISFQVFGVCERSLRHAGIADVVAIVQAVGTSSLLLYSFGLVLKASAGLSLPGSFFVGDGIILFLALSAFHFGNRIYHFSADHSKKDAVDSKRVVIIGAGDAGVSVLNELLGSARCGIVPVALVDDDIIKRGTRICGVPVVGGLSRLPDILYTYEASEVLICIPSATQKQRYRILAACLKCGVPVRTLPSLPDMLSQRASTRDLRAVSIEEALQREKFVPDHTIAKNLVGGKVVLVTGAGGSIGSELCRQIAAAEPQRIILVDKSENSLFYCHLGIDEAFPNLEITPILADVSDSRSMRDVFLQERPGIVFHAAAYKHVGMMERHPDQAIRNNVMGTRNVLQASIDAGVEVFVNVSTDKAVNPRCYMGLSKKLTELLVKETAERHGVRYMSVRFGNVAGSTGSVLRIFSEQIHKGKPIRVTDPHATRYFMSIAEAVSLILCAASMGKGGETFILDMGTPVNIYELARTLTLLAGVMPGEELPIHFTGLKEGEKVNEELWEDWEVPQATENPQMFRLAGSNPLSIDIRAAVQRFDEYLTTYDQAGLVEYIGELVPSFASQRSGIPVFSTSDTEESFAGING